MPDSPCLPEGANLQWLKMLGIATLILVGALTLAPASGAKPASVGPDGWTDLLAFLVPSDGSRSLGAMGSSAEQYNASRDSGRLDQEGWRKGFPSDGQGEPGQTHLP